MREPTQGTKREVSKTPEVPGEEEEEGAGKKRKAAILPKRLTRQE